MTFTKCYQIKLNKHTEHTEDLWDQQSENQWSSQNLDKQHRREILPVSWHQSHPIKMTR